MRKPQSTKEKLQSYEKQRIVLKNKQEGLLPLLFLGPAMVFIISFLITKHPGIVMGMTAFSAMIAGILHHNHIGSGYDTLKTKVRKALINEFMKTYHPATKYKYFPKKKIVKEIVRQTGLVSANRYNEEDVITGTHSGANFYFSEIHLKKKTDKKTRTKFKGILFKIKIPGKSFPKSKIQSKEGLFSRMFGTFEHNKAFDLFINSNNLEKLEEELKPLFPFIAHLKRKQGDIRIHTHGDEIVLLMNSDMKLLDDPNQHLDQTFLLEEYKNRIAQQLNTLLFIVDSFVNNSDTSEIEERLELKSLIEIKKKA